MSWFARTNERDSFVDDLLRHMTFEERIGQLDLMHRSDDPRLADDIAAGRIGGVAGPGVSGRLQDIATERSRLGLPLLFVEERPELPLPASALAACWDEGLAKGVGAVLARSALPRGYNTVLFGCSDGTRATSSPTQGPLIACEAHLLARIAAAVAAGSCAERAEGSDGVLLVPNWEGSTEGELPWAHHLAARPEVLALASEGFTRRAAEVAGFGGLLFAECRRLSAAIAERFHTTTTRTLAEAAERAMTEGAIAAHEVDSAVRGVLATKHALGLFRRSAAIPSIATAAAPSGDSEAMRTRSVVLLRNEAGLLPLSPISDRVLLVGPADGTASAVADGLTRTGIGFSRAPGMAIRQNGAGWSEPHPGDGFAYSLSRDAAQRADFVLVALDDRHFEFGRDGSWPRPVGPVLAMVRALASSGSRLAAILATAGPVDLADADQHFASVLQCWAPGEGLAEALGDILSGQEGPQGRLPMPVGRYSFGQGLGFGESIFLAFRAEALSDRVAVSLRLRNAGPLPIRETVQLYVQEPGGAPMRLVDFAEVSLASGEDVPVAFTLDAEALGRADLRGDVAVRAGRYTIAAGKDRHRLLTAEVEVSNRLARVIAAGATGLRLISG